MKIEVKGVEFSNKGAELMLLAITQALNEHRPDWQLVLIPGYLSPYHKRAALGAWQKFSFNLFAVDWTFLGNLMPAKARRLLAHFGIAVEKDITAVLDASGFVYSDKWGIGRLNTTLKHLNRINKFNRPYVFLPQAFGPFELAQNAKAMNAIVAKSLLVYARDEVSFTQLKALASDADKQKIKCYPDMTTLVDVSDVKLSFSLPDRFIAIVPNSKMFWQKGGTKKSQYLEFITQAVYAARHLGYVPVLINHEGEKDSKMCSQLVADIELASGEAPLFYDNLTALEVKKIIGLAQLCLSSRFHGCVSSLSQAVPTLATSWGHKYEQLFAQYRCDNMVIAVDQGGQLASQMTELLEDKALKPKLMQCADQQKQQNRLMWQEVFAAIEQATER